MTTIERLGVTNGSTEKSVDFTLFRARDAFDQVEGWLLSQEALDLPEHEVEAEMERRGREVWRLMLQAHLNRRGTGDVGPAIAVSLQNGGETRQTATREDPRKIVSIFGEVRAERTAYTAKGREAVHPLDEQAQLPSRSFSYEMQRRVVDEAVRGPFDEALESIEKSTGNRLPKRSAEQVTVDAAVDFDAFYAQRANPTPTGTGPLVVGQVDGKGIPMVKPKDEKPLPGVRRKKGEKANKKKMATVGAVYTGRPRVRTPEEVVASLFKENQNNKAEKQPQHRPEAKRVWASLEKTKDDVITEIAAEMKARDPDGTKLWTVLSDGERALQQRLKRIIPQQALAGILLILDFFHAMERLWTVAHALFGEGAPEVVPWVRDHTLMLLQGKVSQVVKGIRQSVTKRKLRGQRRKKAHAAANYLYRNREHMRYDIYLALGLPIATGTIEGACKNLVKDRMERSGMRWQTPGAEAMLKLRAIKLSGDMQEYWRFHIQQEQYRLYGQVQWKVAS